MPDWEEKKACRCRRCAARRRRINRPRGAFRNIDAALKVRTVFNHDAAGLDISYQLCLFLDIDLVGRIHVALNRALNDNFPSFQSGLDSRIRADRQAVLMALDGTFYLAINCQVLTREDLPFDGYILAQCG